MDEYSRILIEQYCAGRKSAKSRRIVKLVEMSYDCAAEASDADALFLEKAIDAEKNDVRTVLHFHPAIAPVKVGVFPLSKKLNDGALKVFDMLSKTYNCEFDDRGAIGKRYRRQDEIGTPYCITYDFDSEEDGAVTVRDRDSMEQERVKIEDLESYFAEKFKF